MRISREEKEKLRDKILSEALPALKLLGQSGAPVDKIMKKIGLTSGALYSHFESKDDFFAQVILRELDRLAETYRTAVQEKGLQGLVEIIDSYLSDRHLNGVAQGCVFAALGPDMCRQKAAVKALFEEKIHMIFEAAADGLKTGSKQERIDKVRFVFSSMVGALMYARNMRSEKAAQEILRSTKRQLLAFIGYA